MKEVDIAIIGGGSAGLAAAISAYDTGIKDIVLFEKSNELGGILNQCIHSGFGLHTFKEELTGPEYAFKFIKEFKKPKLLFRLNLAYNVWEELRIFTFKTEYKISSGL